MKIERAKVGDVLTDELLNALIDVANSCDFTVGQNSGLHMIEDQGGRTLTSDIPSFIWGKTTGAISGGTYPFTQQFPDSGGTWTAGPLSDVAYEVNGNTSVTSGTYVKLFLTDDGTWRFWASTC